MEDWMSSRDKAWGQTKFTLSNETATLQTIAIHIDLLRSHAHQSDKLKGAATEYMASHKAAQEEWESLVRTSAPTAELRIQFKTKVLMLTSTFAGKVIGHLHTKNSQYRGTVVPPLHCTGDEVNDAEAVQYALTILAESIAVCCCTQSTKLLQNYMLEEGIVETLIQMYTIPREVELLRYGEGYRTCIMRVVANATYDNSTVTAYLLEKGFVPSILSATKIDKENGGLREWAEFTIRNITAYPPVVSYIKELKAQRVSPDSEKELAKAGMRVGGDLSCPKVMPLEKM
eukprot:TRINITY_DN14911_c0_g1_i2.p1 TRINITY_DN14911_c0_g1~~TRINITY_DN14911_c0_g1_i2.p1  ORF type:complete len:308 (+),score=136.44 TRINITY_DN14911_c0_g1_i2:65-925(+)